MISKSLHRFFQLLFLSYLGLPQLFAQEIPRVRLLHPQPGMQFYVDRIEVSGDIPPGSQYYVADSLMQPDTSGRFRYLMDLVGSTITIPLKETRGAVLINDTLRIFHRNLDRLLGDSLFVNNNIPEKLELSDLYPRSGDYRGKTVSLRGKTHPDALLLMNGDTLSVFPSGAFTSYVELQPGENVYAFLAILGQQQTSQIVILNLPIPEAPLTGLDPASAQPRQEQWSFAGDVLKLGISGPASATVQYRIPGLSGWNSMTEIAPGQYQTHFRLADVDRELKTVVQYRLGPFSKRIKSAPLRILVEALHGLTHDPDSRVYDTPSSDQLFFPLADSVSLRIIGLTNRMYRIRLGEYRTGYIYASNVTVTGKPAAEEAHYLGSLRSENQGDWVVFRLYTGDQRLPFECKEKAVPSRLELKVYGAKQGWEWTSYPDSNATIAFIERSQPQDLVWQMDFYPETRFWGWWARYEGADLVIGIRKAPVIKKEQPFANIRIEIDPGHGGWERGARGVTGYAEADANLRYSLKLEKLLKDAGATVFLTRREDRRLSLPERAEIARQDSVHIFVMAHNNAPGSNRDIMAARGSSTFYTWPSSKALSDAIYPYLGNMGIDTAGEVVRYYYYLTRQTEYLVYLIEGAFMTYPPEEMFLLSEEGLDALARAAFLGLHDFVTSQAE